MSVLLIDSGNTKLKWAIYKNKQLPEVHTVVLDKAKLKLSLQKCFSDLPLVKSVKISNVAGEVVALALKEYFYLEHGILPEFAKSHEKFNGLDNAYDDAGQLGIDRWLAMIFVNHYYAKPFCVVDSGTAVTIDAVDANGNHLGGLILPGMQLMKSAINSNTAAIRIEQLSECRDIFGRNTQDALTSGITYSITALVEKICVKLQSETTTKVNCIISGGDAVRLHNQLEVESVLESDVVLKGLAIYSGLIE